MSLDVSEVNRLGVELQGSRGRLGRTAAAGVRESGQRLKRAAQQAAPVLTGTLRRSIAVSVAGSGRGSSISSEVEATARYAGYVEYGTSSTAPQPFMGPALDTVEPLFVTAMEKAAETAMLP